MDKNRWCNLAAVLGFAAGLLAVAAAGCGSKPKLPPLAEVSGTVTLDGKPLPRGMVQFVPDESKGNAGPPATGYLDADGRFTLSTAGVRGAVLGFHRIGIDARQEVDLSQTSWAPSLIPEQYNNPATSGLTAEVKAGQRNVVELKLLSTPQGATR